MGVARGGDGGGERGGRGGGGKIEGVDVQGRAGGRCCVGHVRRHPPPERLRDSDAAQLGLGQEPQTLVVSRPPSTPLLGVERQPFAPRRGRSHGGGRGGNLAPAARSGRGGDLVCGVRNRRGVNLVRGAWIGRTEGAFFHATSAGRRSPHAAAGGRCRAEREKEERWASEGVKSTQTKRGKAAGREGGERGMSAVENVRPAWLSSAQPIASKGPLGNKEAVHCLSPLPT